MSRAAAKEAPAADRVVTLNDNGAPDPRAANVLNIETYLLEARNWLDGSAIENEGQAATVKKLKDALEEASDAADEQRKVEKAPHDDAITEIQGFWNPFIAPLTNKKPGTCSLAIQACNNALTVWLRAEQAKKDAEAAEARRIAGEAAQAARDALAAASQSSDLGAREEAEQLVTEAQQSARFATQVERARPTVAGFGRASGLRENWVIQGFTPYAQPDGPAIDGETALLRYYWTANKAGLVAAALEMARVDVRNGARKLPGLIIKNEPRV